MKMLAQRAFLGWAMWLTFLSAVPSTAFQPVRLVPGSGRVASCAAPAVSSVVRPQDLRSAAVPRRVALLLSMQTKSDDLYSENSGTESQSVDWEDRVVEGSPSASSRLERKLSLLSTVAGLDRGAAAGEIQRKVQLPSNRHPGYLFVLYRTDAGVQMMTNMQHHMSLLMCARLYWLRKVFSRIVLTTLNFLSRRC